MTGRFVVIRGSIVKDDIVKELPLVSSRLQVIVAMRSRFIYDKA